MRKQLLIALASMISTAAAAQDWKPAVDKWRACGDGRGARLFEKHARVRPWSHASRHWLATRRKEASLASHFAGRRLSGFADQFIEAAERHYVDRLSVNVMEMRLHGSEKEKR